MKHKVRKQIPKQWLFVLLFVSIFQSLAAQDFMMQGFYWDYPKGNWADTLKAKAAILGPAGINYLWVPPHYMSSSGSGSNGYNPKDLYDIGEFAGPTGLGNRAEFDSMITAFNQYGVNAVGDMVYNHRDGGAFETNPGVKNYIENFTNAACNPYPADHYRIILPIGGTTGNVAGDYYFRLKSRTQNARFFGWQYKMFIHTGKSFNQYAGELNESEPNGGGGTADVTALKKNMNATIDNGTDDASFRDEFKLTITAADFNAAGDSFYIYLNKDGHGSSDFYFDQVWSGPKNMDIKADVRYQTYTDYKNMPSGRGGMDWTCFKPNNDHATCLDGDWDIMMFFFDYDQLQQKTRDSLFMWTKWNWQNAGIRGLRMDAIKHFTPEFVGDLLDYLYDAGIAPGMVVGEWFDTNPDGLAWWINQVNQYMNPATRNAIKPRIFDFRLRDQLRQACDTYGYDVRNLYIQNMSSMGIDYRHVVSFINNHDFREPSGFNSLIHNDPMLAYAFILTDFWLGTPTIFYPDYFGYPPGSSTYFPNVSPMQNQINQLVGIHKTYIKNANNVEYLNKFGTSYAGDYISGATNNTLIYQISGGVAGKELLVAINFSGASLDLNQQIKMTNGLQNGSTFTNLIGNAQNLTVDANNKVHVIVPGRSYSVWVQGTAAITAPSNLTATATSSTQINLTWSDNSSDETGFVIERKTGASGTYQTIETTAVNVTSFVNSGLSENTTYYYHVKAITSSTSSSWSNEASAITLGLPPTAPTSLTANAINPSQIVLQWTDNSANEQGFKIERKTGASGTWSLIYTTLENAITFTDAGLTENTEYFYRIKAFNPIGDSNYSNEANAITPFGVPMPPTNLSAIAVSAMRIDLTWNDAASNETGFKMERKTGDGSWSLLATLEPNTLAYTDLDGITEVTTYFYRIYALNTAGNSTFSNIATVTTPANGSVNTPTNLTANALSETSIELIWVDNSSDETGFKLERKTTVNGTWSEIHSFNADIQTFTDNALAGGIEYFYRIRAFRNSVFSNFSNEASETTWHKPNMPSNLNANALAYNSIRLTWNDNSDNESGFAIQRKITGGTFAEIATVGQNVVTFADVTDIQENTTYIYRVASFNNIGTSLFSNETSVTTPLTIPVAPINLIANALSASEIDLSWNDVAVNETGYRLFRKKSSDSEWLLLANLVQNSNNYNDNAGLLEYTEYQYRVQCFNAAGNSDFSEVASATTMMNAPVSPTNLSVEIWSCTQIAIRWLDNATNELGYLVERREGLTGNWVEINTLAANSNSYSDAKVSPQTNYYYRVRAFNAIGNSDFCAAKSATTPICPPKLPGNLDGRALNWDLITISWTDSSDNEEGFIIERKTGATGTWEIATSVFANTTTYYDAGLQSNTAYSYRVCAFNATDTSAYSNLKTITTYKTTIENVSANAVKVYPNPTNGKIVAVLPQNSSQKIIGELFDIQGTSVQKISKINSTKTVEIDLGTMSSGIYMLKIEIGDKCYWTKVVKF